MADSKLVAATRGSFDVAHANLDKILTNICQKKWEQEVVEKKGKPHAIGWVFSQAKECYFIEPDRTRITTQFDQDGDEEPVSIASTET